MPDRPVSPVSVALFCAALVVMTAAFQGLERSTAIEAAIAVAVVAGFASAVMTQLRLSR